jgi:hypothetical protein
MATPPAIPIRKDNRTRSGHVAETLAPRIGHWRRPGPYSARSSHKTHAPDSIAPTFFVAAATENVGAMAHLRSEMNLHQADRLRVCKFFLNIRNFLLFLLGKSNSNLERK